MTQIRAAADHEWDEIWRGCDYATFFHSRTWAETWTAYTRGAMRPAPRLVTFSDGTRALLPLSARSALHGLVKRYVTSPARTYGGWISTDDLTAEHAAVLFSVLRGFADLVWRINPYDPRQMPEGPFTKLDDTNVLDLEEGFAAVHKRWSKGHRSAATQSMRLGVTARLASAAEDWRAYYDVYLDALRRWGDQASSRYRPEFFDHLARLDSPDIKLWLAIHEDRVIAGALCLYAKRHVSYWHGAALEQHMKLRPTNLLMYEVIKHACEHGYRWFDFNPSGGHEGVKVFKKNFGTLELPCHVVTQQSALRSAVGTVSGVSERWLGRRGRRA